MSRSRSSQPPAPAPADAERSWPLSVGVEVADTEAEGPGRRYAVWVQGCPMRCPGCCNPELLRFQGGTPSTAGALIDRILDAHARSPLAGLSLLGGEPFAQAAPLAVVAEAVRDAGLSVMVYSGFTLGELQAQAQANPRAEGPTLPAPGPAQPPEAIARLLAATDLLCDGRYDRAVPDDRRRWIGSTNQRLHFLTTRHVPTEPAFGEGETVELRLVDGELIINGWPWGRGLPPDRGSTDESTG